ncbi:MAG: 2-amino-5-chloromuconate deaminase CnbZ [Burkholderiales bacterium]
MSELIDFADGGYAFLKGVYPYSQGVIALPGFALERARFARPLPLAQGFAAIESQLAALGRPRTALCAAELRSPRPFSFDGFGEFNRRYVGVLEDWGIFRAGLNPVARSNVAPELDPPDEPSFHAFCYTVPAKLTAPSFVVAGSGEWPEGGRFPEDIVARGDTSPAGLRTKARWVLATMQQRLRGLGASWADVSATQAYTVHDLHPFLGDEIVAHGAAPAGLTWHYCRPPISGLEYEMDARGVALERVIRA